MKRSNRYSSEEGKAAWNELEKIERFGYSMSSIFPDWLDIILNSLLAITDNLLRNQDFFNRLKENKFDGVYEERYMAIVNKYKENKTVEKGKRPAEFFANAWALLNAETLQKNKDIIGQIYVDRITFGEHGQFYTPEHVCNAMAKMLIGDDNELKTICDPCCGSGRMLIEASANNPNAMFYGTDIDIRCAKMTVINMYLFDLNSEITWGNSLSMKKFITWRTLKGGYIYEFVPQKKELVEVV